MRLTVLVFLTGIFSVAHAQSDVTPETERISVLSWNIYMLPGFLGYGKIERAEAISNVLANSQYDVIVFQEAFHRSARNKINALLKSIYPFQAGPANKLRFSMRTNSGVWILSKYPIQLTDAIEFKTRSGIDAMSRKGALLVELLVHGKSIQIIGTHLQNSGNEDLRKSQCVELYDRLLRKHQRAGIPQIVCGDFNIDRHRAKESYNTMLQTLRVQDEEPTPGSYSYDRVENDLQIEKGVHRDLIDYILTRNNEALLQCSQVAVQRLQHRWHVQHQDLSDHYSIQAEIVFSNSVNPVFVSTRQPDNH